MTETKRVSAYLVVSLRDAADKVLTKGKVKYKSQNGKLYAELEFDKATGLYVTRDVQPGVGRVSITHDGKEEQSRDVTIGDGENREVFILGEPGGQTFFRGKVRVPVTANPGLVGVLLRREKRDQPSELEEVAKSLKAKEQKIPDLARKSGLRLYEFPKTDIANILKRLSILPSVEHVGIVVQERETGFTFLTREVVVKFTGPRLEEARAIAKKHGFRVQRGLVYADGAFVLEWLGGPKDILLAIEKLAGRDDVEWAEPSVVVSPELDAINPGDTLWNGLWDRQLIGLQNAWQALQNAGLDTFGDPDIVLAVWDSGTQSAGGVPTNSDFDGTLSNGQPKVLASFDFENMVANNDSPWDPHGSGVAGVSTAMANNPAPFSAQGVVGSAPNVQMMTIEGRVPYIDIEVADQYLWMAGFDPQSPLAGFPASPLPRGADVITCSLTPGAGSALSGTAQAALDFVTTFGRGGKGTMCFFSTGNANANNVTSRPYGAYEKCFAIAATSIDNDGVSEIRAPYSGWGLIDFCTPSQDAVGTIHNPPTGYMPWAASHLGQGNLPSTITNSTTLSAATAAGATSIQVASVVGLATGDVIHIGAFGANGSEPALISAVNGGTNTLTVQGFRLVGASYIFSGGLLNAHTAGTIVVTGPANHQNNFGGTSSATPLAAGVAALVLSANPSLTYIEAREVLRDTAIKLDLGNATANGQWLDINGDPSSASGLAPIRSGWYGYGRVDAAAAVQAAIDFSSSRDLVIRDNLADTGSVATAGAFWNSPDIWCRTSDPDGDASAFPAIYGVVGPHQSPIRGQQNWICLRVKNNGTVSSLDAWVRISVTHFPGLEFTYPDSWQPTNGPGDPLPSPMTPGTYLIGEAKVSGIAQGADETVVVPWPAGLIPPETVSTPGGNVSWHPCLLAEISPHDGPIPTGNHVWDDNNLAQKNISIVGTDAVPGTDFQIATVAGSLFNDSDCLTLEIIRGRLPKQVQLFVDLMNPKLRRTLIVQEKEQPTIPLKQVPNNLVVQPIHNERRISPEMLQNINTSVIRLELLGKLAPVRTKPRNPWRRGVYEGREVAFLEPWPRVRLPICAGSERLVPLILGGVIKDKVEPGEYEVIIVQRQSQGQISGSATMMINIGKKQRG